MFFDFCLIGAGLFILCYAGDKLVDLSVALASRFRVSPAVIGLLILSAGTSLPELFVSVVASYSGSPDIAIANVVGSNTANVAVILGLAALIAPLPLAQSAVMRLDYPFMLLASFITLLLCRDGLLDRLESGFFVASMAGFAGYSVWVARSALPAAEKAELAEQVSGETVVELKRESPWRLVLGMALCFAGLALGARLLVEGAVDVARVLGVSERVIGLTLVAIGTSLPELVASTAAALKSHHEMALTNIVGSNIFNLLLILGVAGLLRPLPVSERLVSVDMWAMIAVGVLLGPLIVIGRKLSRLDGGILVASYAAYLGLLAAGF